MLNKFLLKGREMVGREGVREEGRRKRKQTLRKEASESNVERGEAGLTHPFPVWIPGR